MAVAVRSGSTDSLPPLTFFFFSFPFIRLFPVSLSKRLFVLPPISLSRLTLVCAPALLFLSARLCDPSHTYTPSTTKIN